MLALFAGFAGDGDVVGRACREESLDPEVAVADDEPRRARTIRPVPPVTWRYT